MEVPCGRQRAPTEVEASKKRKEKKRQTAAKNNKKRPPQKRRSLVLTKVLHLSKEFAYEQIICCRSV